MLDQIELVEYERLLSASTQAAALHHILGLTSAASCGGNESISSDASVFARTLHC